MQQKHCAFYSGLKCAKCHTVYCVVQWSNCILPLQAKNELEEQKYQCRMDAFQLHKAN